MRELEPHAAAEQTRVEAELQLLATLRLELWVAELPHRERRLILIADHGREGTRGVERARLLARRTPGRAQPQLIREAERPERLLRDHPRRRQLRVDRRVELGAERTVVIAAHCGREKCAVAPADLLLHVDADRRIFGKRLGAAPRRATRDRGDRNRRKLLTGRRDER